MQHARMRVQSTGTITEATRLLRFEPVVHLVKGDVVCATAESSRRFEEFAAFGPSGLVSEAESPAKWLANTIEDLAVRARVTDMDVRPIHIEAPVAAMMHPDTPAACEAAAARSRLLPQEICIEVSDASLAQSKRDVTRSIEALRRRGFRLGVIATRSWNTPLDTALRLMLDTVRVDARNLFREDDLMKRVEAAVACGMSVIAERARYRDGYELAEIGVELALRPTSDA
ncbi:MAG: EAL domain-containing protein [Henriciella sp.]|uniref:EAL domain-containing protein n=1 Tax=Henriciella sp. TaxID=1968823 RepID=UPI00262E2FEA|nr:EAL domain-containing protein [Henriciella sp.]